MSEPAERASPVQITDTLYRVLVETVRDYAIFALDPLGNVLTWNRGAARIKGYAAHEIIGRHFSTFYLDEDLATGKPAMELDVATRTGRYEEEGWRLRKDGSRFWANVVITSLWQEGRLIGFAKVTRDLTERREAELRALEDARHVAEVEAANRAKSQFLATMSHELRTPLNAIAGYVDLLRHGIRGPVTEQQMEDLDRIRRSQQHLLAIINDVLNFSRIEAGRLDYRIARVEANGVIEAVAAMVRPLADQKRIDLRVSACREPVEVLADPSKLQQVLLNLLSNAIKFTEEGGLVRVGCATAPEQVQISVEDTGPGIAEGERESIFEPFVQLGRTLSRVPEGAGLGLAISRELARGMGGDLSLESAVGVGSTFTVTLPRA